MGTDANIDKLLERYAPERREALRKILLGTAIYAAPVIASYSMQNLGGVAQAQSQNQTVGQAIPVDSGIGLAEHTGGRHAFLRVPGDETGAPARGGTRSAPMYLSDGTVACPACRQPMPEARWPLSCTACAAGVPRQGGLS